VPKFSFDMYLSPKMYVYIHGKYWVERFVGLRKKADEGWSFHITGNYNRRLAKNAVEEMDAAEAADEFIPRICGLRAAAVHFLSNVQDRSPVPVPQS